MKLLELIVGNLLKRCHFSVFFAIVREYYCDFLTNDNVTVKSVL